MGVTEGDVCLKLSFYSLLFLACLFLGFVFLDVIVDVNVFKLRTLRNKK